MQIDLIITQAQLVDSGLNLHNVLLDQLTWFADQYYIERDIDTRITRVIAETDGFGATRILDAYNMLVNP